MQDKTELQSIVHELKSILELYGCKWGVATDDDTLFTTSRGKSCFNVSSADKPLFKVLERFTNPGTARYKSGKSI